MEGGCHSWPLLTLGVLWVFIPVGNGLLCSDTKNWKSWCSLNKNQCSQYPIPRDGNNAYGFSHCKKTCGICKSDTLCGDGYYGPNCKPCVDLCEGGSCDIPRSGECEQTCDDGRQGFRCDKSCRRNCVYCDRWTGACEECKDGFYGTDCTRRCSRNCQDKACDMDTGECLMGCEPMWEGNKCDKKVKLCDKCHKHDCASDQICRSGCINNKWFGPKCENRCSRNCFNKTCSQDEGNCMAGCRSGFYGDKCHEECSNCRSSKCNQTGHCLKGCRGTYYGPLCQSVCSDFCGAKKCDSKTGECNRCVSGRHGDDCSLLCNPNCDGTCFRKTGKCRDCKTGWYGQTCEMACSGCLNGCERDGTCNGGCHSGVYGDKCNMNCSQQCVNEQCYQSTGECTDGCKDTWYGESCSNKCSDNCRGGLCSLNSIDEPECKDGCIDGRKGSYCVEACPANCVNCTEDSCVVCKPGYHGGSCEELCPSNCDRVCLKDSGHCMKCKQGYHGERCETPCSNTCLSPLSNSDQICEFYSGECLHGCTDGYHGPDCSYTCSVNCVNDRCTQTEGKCIEGCVSGWKGDQCDTPCPDNCHSCDVDTCTKCKPGWYDLDESCHKQCSSFCVHGSCDSHGECKEGCIDGFFGKKCNETCLDDYCLKCERNSGQCLQCEPTWYGSNCNESCDNCAEGNCSMTSGQCQQGCVPGFSGSFCTDLCPDNCKYRESFHHDYYIYCDQSSGRCLDGCVGGYHGDVCDQNCSSTCNAGVCNQTTGWCDYGCESGRYGEVCEVDCAPNCGKGECGQFDGQCDSGCKIGFHGPYCERDCPPGCRNRACRQDTGLCFDCEKGMMGDRCNEACAKGTFGHSCRDRCGSCSRNATCHPVSGNCTNGCANGFGGDFCLLRMIQVDVSTEEEEPAVGSVPIIIAVIAIVVVLVLLLIGLLFYRRRRETLRRRNDKDYLMMKVSNNVVSNPSYQSPGAAPCKALRTTPKKNGIVGSQNGHTATAVVHQENPEADDAYYNLVAKNSTTSVSTTDLWPHVQLMKKNGNFHEQYNSLPTGLIHTVDIAMSAENKGKNRYKNICAFDRSRVVLDKEDGDPNSDYINANYITGPEKPQTYVASQGPVDAILNDFWRMIWQLNTSKIVMLTNIVEEGRMKCVMYWPELEAGVTQYGAVMVECTTEDVLAHYTVRTLKLHKLKQGKSKDKSTNVRIIKHFHFTSWPDKGVPNDAASLVEFYFKVVNTPTHGQGPMVVHCSAGIGRTGTFLALANLIEEASSTGKVDPFTCIHKMRHERVNMVQTEEQYEFLHLALVEAIMAGGTTVATSNFANYYDNLFLENPETGTVRINELFETLNLMAPPYKLEEYQSAMLPENVEKNRFKDILASDYNRPFLSTPIHGRTDYINAVFLPGYKQKRAFILTQMPMQDTVIDFWRLIFETYSQTVVMLNDDNDDQQTVGYYWPQKNLRQEMYGPYFVEVIEEEELQAYKVLTLKATKSSGESETSSQRTIKLFQCHVWPHGQIVPDTATPLFSMMEAIDDWQSQTKQAQVTVHCLDGVERSGLFCVLSAILERVKIEQDVSVLQTINQMRVCRPLLVQNFDQFKFLYTAVKEYLDGFSTYSNFK